MIPGGNIRDWISTFDYLRQFKSAVFIPGHGIPAKLSVFEFPTYHYLKLLDTFMTKAVNEGVDMQDAVNLIDQSSYSHLEKI